MITFGEYMILATLLLVYGIFLFFDLFKRDEPYGNIAYIAAIIPTTYFWYLVTENIYNIASFSWGVTGVWCLLFALWLAALLRDLFYVFKEKKDMDRILGTFVVAILIQLVVSAILPYDKVFPDMSEGTFKIAGFIYLPDTFNAVSSARFTFNILLTIIIIGLVIPMIFLELRGEQINMWALLIIDLIFALPFGILAFVWVPEFYLPLLLLIEVIFFIVLLLITKGNK